MEEDRLFTRSPPAAAGRRPEPVHHRRLNALLLALTAAFVVLEIRLFDLQVLCHENVAGQTRRMFSSYTALRGMRGDIRTREGTLLAREVRELTAGIDPQLISAENLPRVIDLLCRGLGLSDEERRAAHARLLRRQASAARGEASPPRYLILKRGVAEGLAEELRGAAARLLSPRELRGLVFSPIHSRAYPRGPFLGAVVGAVSQGPGGAGVEGAAGLELVLEPSLAGRDGERRLRCEGRRADRWLWPGEVDIPPVHGYNAILTIDSRIQGIAEEELERGLEREKTAAGVAMVMDCQSGDILAMVSHPSLDPNHYHRYPHREFEERRRNRAIESEFEPGSTIKPFIMAVAVEKGLYRADQRIWDGGRVHHFGRRRVEDVSDHGPITVAEAVIHSSNIGMAHLGLRLGRDGLLEVLDRFRFQTRTGLPLPGEADGKRTPRRRWSELFTSISVSFGYEVTLTPLQLCTAFSSLVNGGVLVAPRLVDRLERGAEVVEFPRTVLGRSIREDTSRLVRQVLVDVVERGTARGLRIPGLSFGGKTGTAALSRGREGYAAREYLSSFVAFAPAEEPRLVVLVMVERPRLRHYGSTVAGPVVVEILRRVFQPPRSGGGEPGGKDGPEAEVKSRMAAGRSRPAAKAGLRPAPELAGR